MTRGVTLRQAQRDTNQEISKTITLLKEEYE